MPTSDTIIPEKEWPTSTAGPGCAAIPRPAASAPPMQRGQRVLHAGAIYPLLLEAADDFGPAGSIGEESVYEDDILRLRRRLGAGHSVEQGNSGHSGGGPDQCPAVHSWSPIELMVSRHFPRTRRV